MDRATLQKISFIKFSELYNWSVQYLIDEQFSYNNEFPLVRIGKFLKRNKTIIFVENGKKYKRVTIKTNNGGVFLRDNTQGEKIGTKQQFTVKEGQFIVSKIDARNGAFGVVTKEVDAAIITGNFWTFDVDYNLINPHYLSLITTTPEFIRFCEKSSTGTTNRHYLQQDLFLEVQIPLPPLDDTDAIKQGLTNEITQEKLVHSYNQKIKDAETSKQNVIAKEAEIETYLYDEIGVLKAPKLETQTGLSFVRFKDIEEWGYGKSSELLGLKSSKHETTSLGKNEFLYLNLFRGKSPKYANSTSYILNQKCIRWNYIDTQHMKSVKKEWLDKIDLNFLTKTGDVLINSTGDGTIGRSTIVRETENNLLYDSHVLLLRLNKKYILPEYFVEIFNSNYGQKQIESVKSAQSTKQTELGLTNLKKIHFPLIKNVKEQEKLLNKLKSLRLQIKEQRELSENLKKQAIIDFENIIFKSSN